MGGSELYLDLPNGITYGGTFDRIRVRDGIFDGVTTEGVAVTAPLASIQAARVHEPNRPAMHLAYLALGTLRSSRCSQVSSLSPSTALLKAGRSASHAWPSPRAPLTWTVGTPSSRRARAQRRRRRYGARSRGSGPRSRRAALAVIARDEASHAALAWEVVRWCCAQGGEAVPRRLLAALQKAPTSVPSPPIPPNLAAELADHGWLDRTAWEVALRGTSASVSARLAALI